ncbi:MAG: T9SS type A sorting domain-containing protein, partial [candidate division Zixibacteria bacterium]|nr:T9SS type A sorting domain-containing protein [candidate division Zixibacteria bacterium]
RCQTLSNNSPTSIFPDGYNLYRGDSSNFRISSRILLKYLPPDSLYYCDTEVINGETYYYKITALYSGQESGSSNEVSATPRKGAILETDTDSLSVFLNSSDNKKDYLNLNNSGDLPLDYHLELELVLDDTKKGSDTYGYTWSDNLTQNNLRYEWVDISERGILINQPGDKNEVYGPVCLSFPFPFYGSYYDTLWILTNGVLSFYQWDLRFVHQPLPYSQGYFRLIAPFWSNLVLTDSSEIYLFNSSDSLIVSFEKIKHFKYGDFYTFQVILTEEGSIDFQYKELDQFNDTATVGIQNQDGTCALLVSCNQDYLQDTLRVRINPPWFYFNPMSGEIGPGENQLVNLLFDSRFLPLGNYQGYLKIHSRDKNHFLNTLSIPVSLEVDTTTSVEFEASQIPHTFELGQNYPNPFNPKTTIQFQFRSLEFGVREPIRTTLSIYNLLGQKVRTLLDEEKIPGNYRVVWDGKDQQSNKVSSGIYFYQLIVGNRIETRKMLLLK